MGPTLYERLRVFINCLLEDSYSDVLHDSLLVHHHVHLIVQHSLPVTVEAEPLQKAVDVFHSLSVVGIYGAKFTDGSDRPVGFWGGLLLAFSRLLCGLTGLFPCGENITHPNDCVDLQYSLLFSLWFMK
jgi:hypothetical protein